MNNLNQNALKVALNLKSNNPNYQYTESSGREMELAKGVEGARMNYPTMPELKETNNNNHRQQDPDIDPRFGAFQNWYRNNNGDFDYPSRPARRGGNTKSDNSSESASCQECCDDLRRSCDDCHCRCNHEEFELFCCLLHCCLHCCEAMHHCDDCSDCADLCNACEGCCSLLECCLR